MPVDRKQTLFSRNKAEICAENFHVGFLYLQKSTRLMKAVKSLTLFGKR